MAKTTTVGISAACMAASTAYLVSANEIWNHGVCAGAIFGDDGTCLVDQKTGDICHKFIDPDRQYGRGSNKEFDAWRTVVSPYGLDHRKKANEAANIPFMTYVGTQSPMAKFVLNDLSSILEHGLIVDLQAAGVDRTFWLLKAFRYVTEEPHRALIWRELTQAGVDPLVALVVSSGLTSSWGKDTYCTHASMCSMPGNVQQLARILKYEAEPSTVPYSDSPKNSRGVLYGADIDWTVGHGDLFGSMTSTTKKVPDGWGGYTMKTVAGNKASFIENIKSLTEQARALNVENVVPMAKARKKAA